MITKDGLEHFAQLMNEATSGRSERWYVTPKLRCEHDRNSVVKGEYEVGRSFPLDPDKTAVFYSNDEIKDKLHTFTKNLEKWLEKARLLSETFTGDQANERRNSANTA